MNKVFTNKSWLILICLLLIPTLSRGQGSRYTGSYKKSAPLEFKNQKNLVIEGLEITNANGRAITLWSCENIIIKNCKFKDVTTREAILAERGKNIQIIDCSFENVYGAFKAVICEGGIKFEHNDVKNVFGDTQGGQVNLQAVQLNKSSGAGNSISYNVIENIEGKSSPDDNINIFISHGTPESPIRVANNWIRGGGPSLSGGGIMLGDHGGSYIIAENNIVVNPGQYGMAIAGGNNITIRNNKIYSKRRPVANVGLYANDWTASISGKAHNITIENCEVNWTSREGKLNNFWFGDNIQPIKGLNTNKFNPELNESILPNVIINRANNQGDNTPPVSPPENNTPDSPITQVYIDSYKRIAVKYLVPNILIPHARAEGYSSDGQLLVSMTLPRFNQAFPISAPKGEYYIKITYPELGKSEVTKVTVE